METGVFRRLPTFFAAFSGVFLACAAAVNGALIMLPDGTYTNEAEPTVKQPPRKYSIRSTPLTKKMLKITIKEIELPEDGQNHQAAPVVLADDPKGGLWVAWENRSSGSKIQHLNDKLKPDRKMVDARKYSITGLYGHEDGSLAFSAGYTPEGNCAMYLCRMSAEGKMIFETRLKGDGKEYYKRCGWWTLLDKTCSAVPIAFNGTKYGLIYVVCHFFEDGGIHQADEFVEVNTDGTIDENTRVTWNASHSFWPSIVMGANSNFYAVTACDGFPMPGLLIANYSQRPVKHELLWPRKNWFDNTRLGKPFKLPNGFGLGIAAPVPREVEDLPEFDMKQYGKYSKGPYPIMLLFDETCKKAKAVYLTDDFIPDPPVTGAHLGASHVVGIWGRSSFADKGAVFGCFPSGVSVLTLDGEVEVKPFEVRAPITWGSDAVTLKNGDVVWGGLADDEWVGNDVNNPKKLYVVRIHCKHCEGVGLK